MRPRSAWVAVTAAQWGLGPDGRRPSQVGDGFAEAADLLVQRLDVRVRIGLGRPGQIDEIPTVRAQESTDRLAIHGGLHKRPGPCLCGRRGPLSPSCTGEGVPRSGAPARILGLRSCAAATMRRAAGRCPPATVVSGGWLRVTVGEATGKDGSRPRPSCTSAVERYNLPRAPRER
jgi:hypothetical protein